MPARLIRRKKETIYSDIIKLFFFFTPFFFGLFYEYEFLLPQEVLLPGGKLSQDARRL